MIVSLLFKFKILEMIIFKKLLFSTNMSIMDGHWKTKNKKTKLRKIEGSITQIKQSLST